MIEIKCTNCKNSTVNIQFEGHAPFKNTLLILECNECQGAKVIRMKDIKEI